MKIFVKAKSRAKENKIIPPPLKLWEENEKTGEYMVFVKEEPRQGKANEAIIKILSQYFKISKSSVRLVSGTSSKKKVFEIYDPSIKNRGHGE